MSYPLFLSRHLALFISCLQANAHVGSRGIHRANRWTQQHLAEETGKSKGEISKLLSILDLHPDAQSSARQDRTGRVTKRHLYAISRLPSSQQSSLIARVQRDNLTAVDVERIVERTDKQSKGIDTRGARLFRHMGEGEEGFPRVKRILRDLFIAIANVGLEFAEALVLLDPFHKRHADDNPVVVLPTAVGKTPCLATICRDVVDRWNGRVLVVSHVKELLQQAVDKLKLVAQDLPVGVYSAGLNRRDTEDRVIVAGIQSIYRRACELGAFHLIICDECHLIPRDGDGMYRQFLADAEAVNPDLRVIGLTATPFRLDSGPICSPDHFLNTICYEIGIKELIRDGYLCPLISKAGKAKVDTSSLHIRGGEFVADEVEKLMDRDSLVESACQEIVEYTKDRKSCLIFASGVKHGRHVARVLKKKHGVVCGFVCGETPAVERDELLARFRGVQSDRLFEREPLKYLCNVNVLTTGFDAPNVDCVVLLRPTASPVLFAQSVGRGFRVHPEKANCLVLDYGGNILRHGPVDQLTVKEKRSGSPGEAPAKECPECHSVVATAYSACPDCGYEFPPPDRLGHEATASGAGILSGQVTHTEYDVFDVTYAVHTKRDADEDAPKTMRVDYRVGFNLWQSEWVCVEHTGYARRKAEAWWRRRSPDPVPGTAERAVEIAEAGGVCGTEKITVRSVAGEKYDRIVDYIIGEMPEMVTTTDPFDPEDVPF